MKRSLSALLVVAVLTVVATPALAHGPRHGHHRAAEASCHPHGFDRFQHGAYRFDHPHRAMRHAHPAMRHPSYLRYEQQRRLWDQFPRDLLHRGHLDPRAYGGLHRSPSSSFGLSLWLSR